jgi:hypothetical protein
MDVSSSLMVAMMFVIILSIGIGNILMGIATMVDHRSRLQLYAVHSGWVVLLLLVYLNLFWQSIDIFSIEDWKFIEFLYILVGPILVLFATQVLLPNPASESSDMREGYYAVSRRFFLFLALSQVWSMGVDPVFGAAFTAAAAFNVVVALLAVVLALSQSARLHASGVGVAWLLYIVGLVLRGAGVVS